MTKKTDAQVIDSIRKIDPDIAAAFIDWRKGPGRGFPLTVHTSYEFIDAYERGVIPG